MMLCSHIQRTSAT